MADSPSLYPASPHLRVGQGGNQPIGWANGGIYLGETMRAHETFEQLVARANLYAFLPPKETGTMAKAVKLAKGVKEFNFKASAKGGAAKYPWGEWFNGDLLLLERSDMVETGELDEKGRPILKATTVRDYDVETDAMPPKIKTAARRRYKIVQVSRVDADGVKLVNSLIIKARDMTADERVQEDLKRAEEKAARDADDDAGDDATTDAAAEFAAQQAG